MKKVVGLVISVIALYGLDAFFFGGYYFGGLGQMVSTILRHFR